MLLIVGLGNPGDKYAGNRHNVGFMAVERIADQYRFQPWRGRFSGKVAEGRIGTEKCLLLKPETYMNESGRAVGEAMRFFKLEPDDVTVIYDEIDLAPGKLKVKTGGGNAGHNGLKSVSSHIGNDYRRVRIGVGRPQEKAQVANYVLRDFAKADKLWLEPLLQAIADALPLLVRDGAPAFTADVARRLAPEEKEERQANKQPEKPLAKQAGQQATPDKKDSEDRDLGPMASLLQNWRKPKKDGE